MSKNKERENISIDPDVNQEIKKQAKKQRRSYSNMVEYACSQYLDSLKKRY